MTETQQQLAQRLHRLMRRSGGGTDARVLERLAARLAAQQQRPR